MSAVRVRIAPSPTGPVHIGLARTALYNFLYARANDGCFILRIDDTDRARSTQESLDSILEAMRWLGLDWDEGPEKGGGLGPYLQSERSDRYRECVDQLVSDGKAYPCFCTPEEVQAGRQRMLETTGVGMYDRRCRDLDTTEARKRVETGESHTVRFKIPEGSVTVPDLIKGDVVVELRQVDDWVMVREDGSPLYNLCSAVDDADMEISHVIRGEEHFVNAVKQLLLFAALGRTPPRFAHLPLILGKDGKKLSKRVAQTNLLDYKRDGYPPEALINFFTLLGWGFDAERDLFTLSEAIERFDLAKLSKSGSILDEEKMLWMCGVYIRDMDTDALLDRVTPFLVAAGACTADDIASRRDWFRHLVTCYQERIQIYSELPEKASYLLRDDIDYDAKAEKNLRKNPEAATWLQEYRDALAGLPADAVIEQLEQHARDFAEAREIKFGHFVHPVRAALSGTAVGPGLFDIVSLLGRERVLDRLTKAAQWLQQ